MSERPDRPVAKPQTPDEMISLLRWSFKDLKKILGCKMSHQLSWKPRESPVRKCCSLWSWQLFLHLKFHHSYHCYRYYHCSITYMFPSFLRTDLGTYSSPNLGIPQICPQILGQIRPQISWIPVFVPKFRDKFVPKFGESSNFGTNFGTNSSPITPTTSWAFSFPNLRTSLSPNLGSYQIFPYILGKLFKPIKVLTKFIPKF